MSETSLARRLGREPLLVVEGVLDELGERLPAAKPGEVFNVLTEIAVERVPGAHAASITLLRRGKFRTVAATDERARRADALQYELNSGPCIDAILQRTFFHPNDLREDSRWPEYGRRVSTELGWRSMLSYPLSSELIDEDGIAGLNIYRGRALGFDDSAVWLGRLLATHAALLMAALTYRDRAANVERALGNSRDIGVAIGLLMNQHKITREQAFDLLRIASQRTNRKISDIAAAVGETGRHDLGTSGR
jgi:hypothetical protein